MTINCEQAIELLPWYLNDTLETAEEELVQGHLEGCDRCRLELNEAILVRGVTRRAPRDVIASSSEAAPAGWRAVLRWPRPAWILGAFALIALTGWLWAWRQGRANLSAQQRATNERIAGLESENRNLIQNETQLRQQVDEANRQLAQLNQRVKEFESPLLNSPVLELQPAEVVERGSADQAARSNINELVIPAEAKLVAFILNPQNPEVYQSYSIELLDNEKRTVWAGTGLARSSSNDFTLSLRADALTPRSIYTINVYGHRKAVRVKVESYHLRVKRR